MTTQATKIAEYNDSLVENDMKLELLIMSRI